MVPIIKKGTSKKEIEDLLSKKKIAKSKKSLAKFAGKLNTKVDPIDFQKELRNEWK